VVVALALTTLGVAGPAFADDTQPTVNITSVSTTTMSKGGSSTIKYTVAAPTTPGTGRTTITISSGSLASYVTLSHDGVDCAGSSCSFSQLIATSDNFSLVVTAANAATSAVNGTITIKATVASSNGNPNPDTQALTINAAAAPATSPSTQASNAVTSVSGVVKDIATGAAIPQAEVQLQDDAKHTWSVGSNSKGQFSFKSTADKPIVPGLLVIGASKDGYVVFTRSFTGVAGQSMAIAPLAMTTLTASASPGASDAGASAGDPAGANAGDSLRANPASGGGGGGFSMILIILGAVLVLLGVGAIVLILLRRKDDGAEAGPDDGGDLDPRRGGPTPVPASRGAFHNGPADSTMVARGDAPTAMLQRTPPVDEYPDPYGAPLPPRSPQPGYPGGGYGQGYGQQPSYDDAPTFADQARTNGYGAGGGYPGGGYGDPGYGGGYGEQPQPPGYGKPPPRPPAPADPYAAPGRDYPDRGYGSEQPTTRGYGSQHRGEGGRRDEPTGMFDNYDQVYDQPRGADNGYGGAPGGGYPAPGGGSPGGYGGGAGDQGYGGGNGYGGAGYEQSDGYEPRRGGYDPRGGYPQAGGYEDTRGGGYDSEYRGQSRHAAPPQGGGNDQRRSLDWLDD
jgi:hypothetical protein